MSRYTPVLSLFVFLSSFTVAGAQETKPAPAYAATIAYQLPTEGPLPRTYRVTLAIVEAKNPNWIISQFANGVARTVTPENGGKFQETWNGLDDNYMPVPPGDYGVKGIYMPAKQWPVDGEWHSITPRFHSGASAWMPSPDDWKQPEPFGGDPVGAPFADVAVGPNGVSTFYYEYLENGTNNAMVDLNKPIGYDQFLRAFNSGGAGGGPCVTTDGETVWAFSTDGGPKFVYRADGKPFGRSPGANRPNSYPPEGWVTAMAVMNDVATKKKVVFVAQRGRIEEPTPRAYRESSTNFVDKITAHDGADGKVLAELPLARPRGLAVLKDQLYALHAEGEAFVVSVTKPKSVADGEFSKWERVFAVPANIQPADLEVDRSGRFYLSDTAANKVYQLDRTGKVLRSYGRLATQKPGSYDPETHMAPTKLATWTDADGNDRLLIVERAGPNRASEWSAEGKLIREFMSLQTYANDGYAVDPEHPEHVYLPGKQGWMTRFRVDYDKRTWTVDAVWPFDDNDPRAGRLDRIQMIRRDGRIYFAGRRSFNIFRFENDRIVLSAAILRDPRVQGKPQTYSFWNDADGNGRVDDSELRPAEIPNGLLTYHGQNWTEDLALLAPAQGGQGVWRIAPSEFDAHGNPVFREAKKLFDDPVFLARAAGKADAVHGGNELSDLFPSDWMGADGSLKDGFYVQARGGRNFSANEGAQHKVSRYVPDPAGGYRIQWRTGRTALETIAQPGDMYGGMRIQRPINGLVSVIDQSRCGILFYNDDGLYVDTIFPDGRLFTKKSIGIYPQPGEFFAGQVFANKDNGNIYFGMGKYTMLLFEAEGWSLQENPVHPLKDVQATVSLTASQIASPPDIALSVRGGAGKAKLAHFAPSLGEAAFDGSLDGWESCEPVVFQADAERKVEVRCLYRPDRLLLRWHARLGTKFEPKPLPPAARVFTHDQLADTLSFYIQGDPAAKGASPGGRPGDARFVFGIFTDPAGKVRPTAVAMYPKHHGSDSASPQTYRTPVGSVAFEHVDTVKDAKLAHAVDQDGKGFVLTVALPRSAVPGMTQPFAGGFRTLINFEATFGGHNKFWWANSDGSASRETYDEPTEARLYPGSWAPVEFKGLDKGVTIRNWLLCGPFGGPGAELFKADPNGPVPGTNREMKVAVREFCEAAKYPPDSGKVDPEAVYQGEMLQGYWRDPGKVRWKPAEIAELDQRAIVGIGGQVWYGANWIYAPEATELEFQFQSHPQTYLQWYLNEEPVAVKHTEYKETEQTHRMAAAKKLTLKAGWNQIRYRGYCTGYAPFRVGLTLNGPADSLWNLQLSNMPK